MHSTRGARLRTDVLLNTPDHENGEKTIEMQTAFFKKIPKITEMAERISKKPARIACNTLIFNDEKNNHFASFYSCASVCFCALSKR